LQTSRLRPAASRARNYLSHGLVLCALVAAMVGCGGSDSTTTGEQSSSLPTSVAGADGASVHLRQINRDSAQQATIRVARDSTGAPALDASLTPLGPVYQYTPHGWLEDEIELRVPFHAEGNAVPRLMVAQPGGRWSEVVDARREGLFMVGRVLQLGYATVVSSAEGSRFSDRVNALAARARSLSGTESEPAFAIAVGAGTTPALPAATPGSWPKVTSQTNLVLDVTYNLPACSVAPEAEVVGMTWQGNLQNIRYVNLGRRALSAVTGSTSYSMPLTEAENGNWVFQAYTWCQEPHSPEAKYSKVAYSQKFAVEIGGSSPIPAPVVSSHPADVAVAAGTTASFTVVAQGGTLAYEWQRSSDGGASYATLAGSSAATYSLTTSIADSGALFRVRVTNASGTVVSTPALLTVTQVVVAPSVTTDPSSQNVLEGSSATFSVVGTGQPGPTIQWQRRAAGIAAPEEGWSDVEGATSNSFTVLSLTAAQSGTQYRAVLRNSAGIAASLPATVTVSIAVIPPSIVTGPQPRTVTAGQFGLFSVAVGGTTPISYQWFRNGQPLVGENASEVLVFAEPTDAGSTYQITVQVSNSAGTVSTAPIAMIVALSGTTVDAATGGVVESSDGTALDIPAGALTTTTVVAVTNEVVPQTVLPADVVALSDAIEIRPANLQFSTPVEMTVTISAPIPDGMTIAFVDVLPYEAGALRASVASAGNLRRAAAAGVSGRVKRAAVTGVNLPSNLACGNVQNVDTGGKYKLTGIMSAIRKVAVAVPVSLCSSVEEIVPTPFPRDTDQACSGSGQFSPMGSSAGLVNRHVQCLSGLGTNQVVQADLELVSTNPNTGVNNWRFVTDPRTVTRPTSTFTFGRGDFQTELSISGPSNVLTKRFTVRQRLVNFERETQNSSNTGDFNPTSMRTRPVFSCGGATSSAATCTYDPVVLSVPLNGGWSQPQSFEMRFNWTAAPDSVVDFETFQLYGGTTEIAVGSSSFDRPNNNPPFSLFAGMVMSPLRCDRNGAQQSTRGCVFPEAAAVYVQRRSDTRILEAAAHIFEAQTGPIDAPGRFRLREGTRALPDSAVTGSRALQRARDDVAQFNRARTCGASDSLYNTRLPLNRSQSCAAGAPNCQCDEYPFASTWSGGYFRPSNTSAKLINGSHNQSSGGGLPAFLRKERVIDFTRYPSGTFDPATISHEGDDYWVYAE
jgi:hypothetical protein